MKKEDYEVARLYTPEGNCRKCGHNIVKAGQLLGDADTVLKMHARGHQARDFESLTYRLAATLIAEGLGQHEVIDELREFNPEQFDIEMTRIGT